MKLPGKTTTLLIILSTLLLWWYLGSGPDEQRKTAPPDPNERIHFQVLNTHFSIPRKYFKGMGRNVKGSVDSVNLWALLPDFEAYDKNVNYHEFREVYHKGRRIQIMVVPRGRVVTVPVIVERGEKSNYSPLGGRHRGGKHDGIVYGLEYYKAHESKYPVRSVYIYRDRGKAIALYLCDEYYKGTFPGCQVNWDYNDKVAVLFDFSKEYLPRWRDILSKVKLLLDGDME